MFKKLLVIITLALLSISCSLTDSLFGSEPQVIVVTATPETAVSENPVEVAATAPAADPMVEVEQITDTISEPVAATLTRLAGPFTSTLVREDEYLVPWYCAGVDVQDFVARVTFTSLPAFDQNNNSFAFFFRQTGEDADQYRLIIYRDGWELYNVRNMDHVRVNSGYLDMTWDIHGDNTFELYAVGDTGYFYLNGYRIYTLNLKDRDFPGNVCVVSSVYTNNTYGVVTEFEDFEVWQLDPQ